MIYLDKDVRITSTRRPMKLKAPAITAEGFDSK